MRLHKAKLDAMGSSLLDVLIGMVVLMIALSSAFMLSLHASRTMQRSQQVAAASSLAEYKIEELRNLDLDQILGGSDPTTLNALGEPDGRFTRSWQVVDNTPVAGLKEVTVTVSWIYEGQSEIYALTGVIGPAEVMP